MAMGRYNRREFLADVGRGMLVASVGSAVAYDLGIFACAADAEAALNFGPMEPLAAALEQTPTDRLLPMVVERMKSGTDLKTLVAAASLANARAFGGQDYTGYHSFMALAPAYHMAQELPEPLRPLPILKVLYRNTNRIHECGGSKHEAMHVVHGGELPKDRNGGEMLREATRRGDMDMAERTFATLAAGPINEAYNHLQFAVQDEVDVHRVVLAWRAWALLDLAGPEHAQTLLRQSVRYCVDAERYLHEHKRPPCSIRTLLPRLLDQYKLVSRPIGDRKAEDAWVEHLCQTIYAGGRERAAEAAAAALAEGMAPESVGEAISLAANRLVLCDPGRKRPEPGKPVGSVHGASVGVHASDSANAWRNIARVSNSRNTVASLIVGAYHTAGQEGGQNKTPYPEAAQLEKIRTKDAAELLRDAEAAVRSKDQAQACALVHQYGELGHSERPMFDLLLRYAVSEDGALHAEKYYRTVSEEFRATRPAFRWRHLAALARVTASEYGFPAPGYREARELLKV
jgi:hypothetical protein